jgi:hypothetical protein
LIEGHHFYPVIKDREPWEEYCHRMKNSMYSEICDHSHWMCSRNKTNPECCPEGGHWIHSHAYCLTPQSKVCRPGVHDKYADKTKCKLE